MTVFLMYLLSNMAILGYLWAQITVPSHWLEIFAFWIPQVGQVIHQV